MSERSYLKYCDNLHAEVGFHATGCPVCAARSEQRSAGWFYEVVGGMFYTFVGTLVFLWFVAGSPVNVRYVFDGQPHTLRFTISGGSEAE